MGILKKLKKTTILVLVMSILLVCTVALAYTHNRAYAIGTEIGKDTGKLVGLAIGSYKGVTKGLSEGEEAGRKEAQAAKDTEAELKGTMLAMGRLEVLSANVTLTNFHQQGESYKGLFVIPATMIFTVDFEGTSIVVDDNKVHMQITKPEMTLYPDFGKAQKLAEIQKWSWKVDSQDALEGYINSLNEVVEKASEAVSNYEAVCKNAEQAAITQVEQLARAICGENFKVEISIKEAGS